MKKHNIPEDVTDDESDGTGTSGQSGAIEFRYRDIFATDPRDNPLSVEQTKQHLLEHASLHKDHVTKQRILRKERKARKEGPVNLNTSMPAQRRSNQYGVNSGVHSKNKPHPISAKAQFSGATDQKVVNIADLNNADTNENDRKKLEQRYEHRLTNTPKFNPKPRPY